MTYPIRLNSPADVTRVSDIIANTGIPMQISCGTAIIDARSVLGLFPFVGKNALLVAPDGMNPNKFMKLVDKLGVAARG